MFLKNIATIMVKQSRALSAGSHLLTPAIKPAVLMGMVLGLSVIAPEAKAISFVTNRDALNAVDHVNWSPLAPLVGPLSPPAHAGFLPNSFTTAPQAGNSYSEDNLLRSFSAVGTSSLTLENSALFSGVIDKQPRISELGFNSSKSNYSTLFKEISIPAWKHHPSSGKDNCPTVNTWPQSSGHFNSLVTTDSYRSGFPKNNPDSAYMGDSRYTIPNSSGFFQVTEHEGKFTFVDPSGHPFYSLGVNSVRPTQDGAATINAFNNKYAGQSEEEKILNWGAHTTHFLKNHGFNTMGSWSHEDLDPTGATSQSGTRGESPLVRTPNLQLLKNYWQFKRTNRDYLTRLVDGINTRRQTGEELVTEKDIQIALLYRDLENGAVESFEDFVSRRLDSKLTDDVINDSRILGFFLDNEIPFSRDLIDVFLRMDPEEAPYKVADDWLKNHVSDPNVRSGIRSNLLAHREGGKKTERVRQDFLMKVVDDYFSLTSTAFRSRDPNHLLLGSRFFKHNCLLSSDDFCKQDLARSDLFEAAAPHVDVISINLYHSWTPSQDLMNSWVTFSGLSGQRRPFLISEFYVKAKDAVLPNGDLMPNCGGAGWIVPHQWQRGRFYQNFSFSVLRNSGSVGIHWFNYMDGDPEAVGRNSASNKGIVDIEFKPHRSVVRHMRTVNDTHYRIREELPTLCDSGKINCVD
ncbi:MAG: hypothetical protein QNJ46_17500 [Leptolyngbyaceae cyanobacterium MO_188.B28]|nr:hypothetical protein [Leptolyngbyaceae cyanobacterium MO_188.B28]